MTVELVAYTVSANGAGTCEDVVERAAAVCYDSTPTLRHKIAAACARSGHMSVWEHACFTFHIAGVSRALLAQLSRHRHISLSVRSQRYCKEVGYKHVTPQTVCYADGTAETFADAMFVADEEYRQLLEEGIPAEDARYVLPNACATELYMTANARTLIEMSRLRLCMRAQWEIRELFQELKHVVGRVSPMVAEMMVPKCEQYPETPFCSEAKGCGRHPGLHDVYVRRRDGSDEQAKKFE